MLRSYLPKGHPLKHLELGSEPTPEEYIANMVRVFGLVREVMAPHATLWLNIGDSYSSGGGANPGNSNKGNNRHERDIRVGSSIDAGNLCLIPQRLAIALQADGWIVRSQIIWQKPSATPASLAGWQWKRCRVKVKGNGVEKNRKNATHENRCVAGLARFTGGVENPDLAAQWSDCPGCKKCEKTAGYVLRRGSWRPTSSWEPILMLAKSDRYYADGEAVKTLATAATVSRDKYTRILDDPDEQFAVQHDHETECTSGANLRDVWKMPLEEMTKEELIDFIRSMDNGSMPDVWRIAAEPLKERHYAAYPTALVERALRAATSAKGYCPACGAPWVRVVEKEMVGSYHDHNAVGIEYGLRQGRGGTAATFDSGKTIGWEPSCSCPGDLEPRPGLVLDPFAGSSRTGIASQRLGLDFVGVDLNEEYVALSERLLNNDMPLFS